MPLLDVRPDKNSNASPSHNVRRRICSLGTALEFMEHVTCWDYDVRAVFQKYSNVREIRTIVITSNIETQHPLLQY